MYLFSRAVRLAPGDQRQQMHWAEMITEKVNQISDIRIVLWAPFASPQTDTLVWSCAVPNLSALEAINDKLIADPGFMDLQAEGARFGTDHGVTDQLVNLIHSDQPSDPSRIRYATAAMASAMPGMMGQAMKLGVEIAKRIKTVTGMPSSFGMLATGPTNTFQWATYCESIEQVESGMAKLYEDNEFMKLTDVEASKTFSPGGDMTIVRRLL